MKINDTHRCIDTKNKYSTLCKMCRKKHDLEELLAQTCNVCNEWFETMQGLMAHQSMSKKCSWYKKGKLKAIFEPSPEQQVKSSSEFAQAQRRQEASPNTVNW